MGKEGVRGILNSREAKINLFILLAAVSILIISSFFVQGIGTIKFNNTGTAVLGTDGPNSTVNISTTEFQLNVTASIASGNASLFKIANITINITLDDGTTPVLLNNSRSVSGIYNNSAGANLTDVILNFNLSGLPEGIFLLTINSTTNGSIAATDNGKLGNSTNITLKVDLSSPVINATNSNNVSYFSESNGNRTDNTLNFTITAYDLITGVRNITLYRNGTEVNSSVISNNVTRTIKYALRGVDINEHYNFTINVTDYTGRSNSTDGVLITVTSDGTPPGPILINSQNEFNLTSSAGPVFNFTAYDNNDTSLNCNLTVNSLNSTIPYMNISGLNVTNGTAHVNTSSVGFTNGTYAWNVSCSDGNPNFMPNSNSSLTQLFTVDNIAPRLRGFNFTNNTDDLSSNFLTIGNESSTNGKSNGGNTIGQGTRLFGFANFTDNLTTVAAVILQFYNESSGSWQTINTTVGNANTLITGFSTKTPSGDTGYTNLSFGIPTGHNEFEGNNISFRFLANDSLGNINNSGSVRNITIQINDTTAPTITINGTAATNGSNLSTTTFLASWSMVEFNSLTRINVSVDSVDQASENTNGCSKFASYAGVPDSGSPTDPNARRNSSFSISTTATCPLGNGTHSVAVTAQDSWGNVITVNHNFTVTSGTTPGVRFLNLTNNARNYQWNKSVINASNITSKVGVALGASDDGVTKVDKLTYTSSCDSSSNIIFANSTVIFPFNGSSCNTASANRTLTVTVNDTSGNSNTTIFTFLVDNVAPSMAVNYPTSGQQYSGENISLNLSVRDNDQALAFVGYYVDSDRDPITINMSQEGGLGAAGLNTTLGRLVNFNNSGTRTIKFTANDSLGNTVNSSAITITIAASVNVITANNSISRSSGGNVSNLTFLNSSNENVFVQGSRLSVDQTLKILAELNETASKGANLTIVFNGSAANWNKTNVVRFIVNDSSLNNPLMGNTTATIIQSVYVNSSLLEFLPDNNSYYGILSFGMNVSKNPLGGQRKLYYFADELNLRSPFNVTECAGGFNPTPQLALSAGSFPCWNTTNNKTVDIFVPHFSLVVFANDSSAPTINVSGPGNDSNQSVSMFVPNITVSADAVSCKLIINGSTANETMVKDGNICLGSTQRFKNNIAAAGLSYNINFTVEDSGGNINNYVVNFNVTDTTPPNTPNATRVSVSVASTTATITISVINESVNASAQSNGSSSFTTGVQTDYNQTQVISLSSLTASTKYDFNVTVCDFAGNCAENATGLSFTTSAAAADSSSSSTTSSSSGGGGGTPTASAVSDSKAQVWSSVPVGSSVSLNIDKEKIAVTSVAVENAKSDLSNVELEVASLSKNPVSEEASSKVYQYLKLTKKNIKDTDAESFKVGFRVTKEWLTSNSLASGDVALYRYNNGWTELSTSVVSSDATYINYEANTPGFSSFAIGAKSTIAPVEEAPKEEAKTEEKPAEEEKPETVEKPEPVKAPSKSPMAWIIAAVVVILGIIMIAVYQKNKKNA